MKAFIASIITFALILGGIVWYEISLNANVKGINNIIEELSANIDKEDLNAAKSSIENLEEKWTPFQNRLMAFMDHKDILEISCCLTSIKTYCEHEDFNEMNTSLKNFSLLLNCAVESSKPTLVNIL